MGVLNIRPTAAGDSCEWQSQVGSACPNHWDNVEGEPPSGSNPVNYASGDAWVTDLYNFANHTTEADGIIKIEVYLYAQPGWTVDRPSMKAAIRIGGTTYEGSEITLTTLKWYDPYEWAVNPYTGLAWTWTDIDNLQAGAAGRSMYSLDNTKQTIWGGIKVLVTYGPRWGYFTWA